MSEAVAVLVPQANPNDENAVLVRWHVASGSRVTAGQPLVTLETTKANFDVQAPRGGYAFFDCPPKTLVNVGAAIAWISESETPPRELSMPAPTAGRHAGKGGTAPNGGAADEAGEARFTRKALRLMRQHGLTPADFSAAGRIDMADVERVAQERSDARPAADASGVAGGSRRDPAPQPPSTRGRGEEEAEPLEQSPSKIIEVQTLAAVYRQIVPSMVSLSVSCELTDARLRALAEQIGPISLLELAIHEIARLLADFAELNGYYADGRAWRYRSVAVGFAINLGHSLRVPVVRRAAELSQLDIARGVRDLSLRYMRDELQMEDVTGGTFTVTDLSGQGVEHFIPVLNHRQAAILGICAERAGSGRRDLVLAFDHRMSDGMRAAQFLAALRERLESGAG